MGGEKETRWIRVLGFATVYFFTYIILFAIYFLYLIGLHMTVYSYTLDWVLLNPQVALRIIFTELTRSPLSLPTIMLCSFILGFITDQISQVLPRKRGRMELDSPKT